MSQILTEIPCRILIWTATSTIREEISTGIEMESVTENMTVTEISIWISIQVDVVLFRVVLVEILTCELKKKHFFFVNFIV